MNSYAADRPDLDYDIIDIHAHFFPREWFEAVWEFFERHNWRINYKGAPDALAEMLRGFGVSHFSILNYLHRPGMRDSLAAFTRDFAARHAGALPFGTLYPGEPGNLDAARLWFDEWGFAGLKIQPLVSKKPINDPDMYPVFELMAERGRFLLVHAGTAPYPNEFTSLDALHALLRDVPGLPVILAHMGGYDFGRALDLLAAFPNLCLDTTMIFVNTNVFDSRYPIPMERVAPFIDRILFGSDFPNIPYAFRESVDGLVRYGFEGEALEKILRGNAARIFKTG
jgi:uncharacterized protein